MKQYLIDTLHFNDWANKKMLSAMEQLTDKKDAAAIFSHIITLQDKWLLRAKGDPAEAKIKWWDTPLKFDELGEHWAASLQGWLDHLNDLSDGDLDSLVKYSAEPEDNGDSQLLKDILLQINYHSILHRAEIGLRLRDQGLVPPSVDYIYYLPPRNQPVK